MQVTLSLLQPDFPYRGTDGESKYPAVPNGKKFLIIKNLDERFTIKVQFFSDDSSTLESLYSTNDNIILPLKNDYKSFAISLDLPPLNNPNHTITFDVEFE